MCRWSSPKISLPTHRERIALTCKSKGWRSSCRRRRESRATTRCTVCLFIQSQWKFAEQFPQSGIRQLEQRQIKETQKAQIKGSRLQCQKHYQRKTSRNEKNFTWTLLGDEGQKRRFRSNKTGKFWRCRIVIPADWITILLNRSVQWLSV